MSDAHEQRPIPIASELAEAEAERDRLAALVDTAREFIQDEYEDLLMSVCYVVDGKPVRERIDEYSVELVEKYEAMLASLSADGQ